MSPFCLIYVPLLLSVKSCIRPCIGGTDHGITDRAILINVHPSTIRTAEGREMLKFNAYFVHWVLNKVYSQQKHIFVHDCRCKKKLTNFHNSYKLPIVIFRRTNQYNDDDILKYYNTFIDPIYAYFYIQYILLKVLSWDKGRFTIKRGSGQW